MMSIPRVDELKEFIVRKASIAVYHENIDAILEIINKFVAWTTWYENNADENEKKK